MDVLQGIGVQKGKGSNYKSMMNENEWGNVKFKELEAMPLVQAELFPQSPKGQRPTNLSIVSESGFYKITLRAFRSNPKAKAFQDWVTQEVLPRIRKTVEAGTGGQPEITPPFRITQ